MRTDTENPNTGAVSPFFHSGVANFGSRGWMAIGKTYVINWQCEPATLPVRITIEHNSFPNGQIDLTASDPQTGGQLPTATTNGAGFRWTVPEEIDGVPLQPDNGRRKTYKMRITALSAACTPAAGQAVSSDCEDASLSFKIIAPTCTDGPTTAGCVFGGTSGMTERIAQNCPDGCIFEDPNAAGSGRRLQVVDTLEDQATDECSTGRLLFALIFLMLSAFLALMAFQVHRQKKQAMM